MMCPTTFCPGQCSRSESATIFDVFCKYDDVCVMLMFAQNSVIFVQACILFHMPISTYVHFRFIHFLFCPSLAMPITFAKYGSSNLKNKQFSANVAPFIVKCVYFVLQFLQLLFVLRTIPISCVYAKVFSASGVCLRRPQNHCEHRNRFTS